MYSQMENVNQIELPDETGKGGIHLSNWHGVCNKDYLIKHKITHVVSALPENLCEISEIKELGIVQKRIHCEDCDTFNLYDRLHESADFILEGCQKGNVLVHCAAGISRSTTCLLSYYIKHRNMSMQEALSLVRKSRPIATPNSGFQVQLRKFEGEVRKSRELKD